MNVDFISYLKILGGMTIIFPLIHVFFALDFGLLIGGIIAGAICIFLSVLGMLMFNYLEYGHILRFKNYKQQMIDGKF